MMMLHEVYNVVYTLEEFLTSHQYSQDQFMAIIDCERYRHLLKTTIICSCEGAKSLSIPVDLKQEFSQKEMVKIAVKTMISGTDQQSTNLLCSGYNKMPWEDASVCGESHSTFPNSVTASLTSSEWDLLHKRVGDKTMWHLLMHTSIFLAEDAGCYIQASGIPLYEVCAQIKKNTYSKVNSKYKLGKTNQAVKTIQTKGHSVENLSEAPQQKSQGSTEHTCRQLSDGKEFPPRRKRSDHEFTKPSSKKQKITDTKNDSDNARPSQNAISPLSDNACTTKPETSGSNCVGTKRQISGNGQVLDAGDKAGPIKCQISPHSHSKPKPEICSSSCSPHSYSTPKPDICSSSCSPHSYSTPKPDICSSSCSPHSYSTPKPDICSSSCSPHSYSKPKPEICSISCARTNLKRQVPAADDQVSGIACKKTRRGKRKRKMSNADTALEEEASPISTSYQFYKTVDRSSMLYCTDHLELFPRYAGLYKLQPDEIGTKTLMNDIFVPCLNNSLPKNNRQLPNALNVFKPLAQQFLLIHGDGKFRSILNAYCPLKEHNSSGKKKRQKIPDVTTNTKQVADYLHEYCTYRQVFLFVRAVCKLVFPVGVLGSNRNWNIFFGNVKRLIALGRHEDTNIGQLMIGMKVTKIPWLRCITPNSSREVCLATLLQWMVKSYVMMLLKGFFYITDADMYKNRLFYYRKTVWKEAHRLGVEGLVSSGKFKEINQCTVDQLITSGRCLGVSSLRFMPKTRSLRPITNMGADKSPQKMKFSVNQVLKNVLIVLNMIKDQDPSLIGSSKLGTDDIYESWRSFVVDRKKRNDTRPLYFVKVDIEKCFDSVNPLLLYKIVKQAVRKNASADEYAIRRYAIVYQSDEGIVTKYLKNCTQKDDREDFRDFVQTKLKEVPGKYRNAVFVNQFKSFHVQIDQMLKKLLNHIGYNVIKISDQYYKQCIGIAQGSVLSTLLCNLYYGAKEKKYINFINSQSLLMRQVDDFLLVTPSIKRAKEFLQVMLKGKDVFSGIPEFNCQINPAKTVVNFETNLPNITQLRETAQFPWCGFIFNTNTLEVCLDFSRYSVTGIRYSISMDASCSPVLAIQKKLKSTLKLMCHAIILDKEINSRDSVAVSLFKVFLLTAHRFHCLVRLLPAKQRADHRPKCFLDMIVDFSNGVLSQVKKKIKDHSGFEFDKKTVIWILLQAFTMKLQRHSQYKVLLREMKSKANCIQRHMDDSFLSQLQTCFNTAVPDELFNMKT